MKTHTLEWSHINPRHSANRLDPTNGLNTVMRLSAKLFVALVLAFAIVVGAALAISVPSVELYLQVSIWTSGFIFLALALESEIKGFWLALASGLALPVLAILSSYVASEFLVLAAALIASWIAAAILRHW